MNADHIELIIKILGAIIAIFMAIKIYIELRAGNQRQLREQYAFAKEFLNKDEPNSLHPYLIEKGYQALSGNKKITPTEAKYLLSLEQPSQCLTNFAITRHLLRPLVTTGPLRIEFKSVLRFASIRWLLKYLFVLIYVGAIIAMVTPSVFYAQLKVNLILALAITVPFFGLIAVLAIRFVVELNVGEELIRNQNEHTQRIVTNV